MGGNLVELAQRFVHLSRELDATSDAMKRLLLNGTGSNENPTPARRPGAKRPQSSGRKMVVTAQVEETILALLQSFRPAHDPSKHAPKRRPLGHRHLRGLQPPSRRQRRPPAGERDRPQGRQTPPVQQLRRQDDIDPPRLA
jgi:hypothetical protein